MKNKEILTKQHEEKSLPHYESEQWKGHWSGNNPKINVATCWHEIFDRKMWQMIKMNFSRPQLQEPPWQKSQPVCVTCNQNLQWKIGWKSYLERAHWGQVKFLWQIIQK